MQRRIDNIVESLNNLRLEILLLLNGRLLDSAYEILSIDCNFLWVSLKDYN